jgi:hypothetical protein
MKEGFDMEDYICYSCGKGKEGVPYRMHGKVFCSDACLTTHLSLTSAAEQEGNKFDNDKLRTDLLPIRALEEITEVFTFGAKKYGDRNWEKGLKWTRLVGAMLRHLFAYIRGEDRDKESGLLHLAHLGCTVLMALTFYRTHKNLDDRVKEETTDE